MTTAEFDTHRSNERNKALLTERDAAQTDLSHWRKVFLYGFQPPDVLSYILPLVSDAIDKSRNSGFDVGFIQYAVARRLKEISAPAQVPPMLYAMPFACSLFTSALVLPESLGLATITTFGQLVVAARDVRPEVLPFLQAVVQTYAHRTKHTLSDGQSAFVLRTIELLCLTLSPKDRSSFVEPVFNALLPHLSQHTVLNQALLVRIQDGCSKSTFTSGISLREAAIRASESAPPWDLPPHSCRRQWCHG